MVKRHLKRLAAPRTWPIKRKGIKFISRPSAGAHTLDGGLPINVFLRDMLGTAKTNVEVKKMLYAGSVNVDGKKVSDARYNVGFMDVVSFPKLKEYYRILFNQRGFLDYVKIDEKESNVKLSKITGKTKVKGKTQLNLSDGRNILDDKDDYKIADVLVIELPSQKIKQKISLEKGSLVYITAGKHIGTVHTLEEVSGKKIFLKTDSGNVFETLKKYAFVLGKEKSLVSMIK